MGRFVDAFNPPYMQRALLGVLIVATVAGAVGVHVVLRRLAFVADTMSHTVFPGIVIAFALDQSLYLGALVLGALTAVALAGVGSVRRVGEDATLAVLLTTAFALGVVIVSRQRTYTSDLTAFLFGRVLTIDAGDLWLMAGVGAVTLAALAALHKELVLRAFDADAAAAMGYPLTRIDLALHLLVAAVVVTALKVVGTALAVALLLTPAATARLCTSRVHTAVAAAIGIGVVGSIAGLVISYEASVTYDVRLAAGATIVSVLTAGFAVAAIGSRCSRAFSR